MTSRSAPWRSILLVFVFSLLCFVTSGESLLARIRYPETTVKEPIRISADHGTSWREGDYEVLLLEGNCRIVQGKTNVKGKRAVIWIDRARDNSLYTSEKVLAYFEDQVDVSFPEQADSLDGKGQGPQRLVRITDRQWHGNFVTIDKVELPRGLVSAEPRIKPDCYHRAAGVVFRLHPGRVQQAQYAALGPPDLSGPIPGPAATNTPEIIPAGPAIPDGGFESIPPGHTHQMGKLAPGTRRVEFYPRSNTGFRVRTFPSPTAREQVVIIEGGVQVIIRGLALEGIEQIGDIGTIDIAADRLVIWTAELSALNTSGGTVQSRNVPLELYIEGNIVFRQGDRVVYANSMYYNVNNENGVVLDAEMLTPAPQYRGLVRLKADVLQQLDRRNFHATGASLTSSRMGVPQYWFQSGTMDFQDIQRPVVNPFTGQRVVDPLTGEEVVDHEVMATSRNNLIYVSQIPVFYWPVMATDATKPYYYISGLKIGRDSVFGTKFQTEWDTYQLLGWGHPPQGTDWKLDLDWLSKRGFGVGTEFEYDRVDLLGIPGPYKGNLTAWGIRDSGLDNLGLGRRTLVPETKNRGQVIWQHRHEIGLNWQFTAEFGGISDRNFLAEYYEDEWFNQKDATTGLELKKFNENSSWSLIADFRMNDFFTETEWLPRFDHFIVGQSFLWDRLTWNAHSHVGFGRVRTGSLPTNPDDPADPLPWETDTGGAMFNERKGLVGATRHSLDLPLEAGPVKVVPFVMGELAYWGEDRDGNSFERALGQVGVRASMPMWKVDPEVQSTLLNLNGMAHKVIFDGEILWADASKGFEELPLYNPLDDNSTEYFLRRIQPVAQRYDSRYFAFRSGTQSWATTMNTEIAQDLVLGRVGIDQRWQTKRGPCGNERIIDFVSLDVDAYIFPQANRDNYGEVIGPLTYDFRWHIGDRFALISDGYFDLFSNGLRTFSLGGYASRPERGDMYLGFRSLEGPVSSNLIEAMINYRMSDKWIASYNGSINISNTGDISQSLDIIRIGESFLISLGLHSDKAQDNVGFHLNIEPRFLATSKSGRVGGVQIPPAGYRGLE